MNALQILQNEITDWANQTFPATSWDPIPPAEHLSEEVGELISSLMNDEFDQSMALRSGCSHHTKMEFADCMILLLQSAKKAGINMAELTDLCREKFEINKKRKWNQPDENGVAKHID